MPKIRSIILILVSSLCASCFPIGDAGMRVRGHIVDSNGEELEGCILTPFVRLKREDMSFSEGKVAANFEETFLIAPKRETYFFRVTCDGYETPFQSQDYDLREMKDPYQ